MTESSENSVVSVRTTPVNGPQGPATALMLAVTINDPASAEAFVAEVIRQFKLQRMLAPPDASLLLITLVGDLPAERFAARWCQIARSDDVLRAFMELMSVADVVQGTPAGVQLSRASLLGA